MLCLDCCCNLRAASCLQNRGIVNSAHMLLGIHGAHAAGHIRRRLTNAALLQSGGVLLELTYNVILPYKHGCGLVRRGVAAAYG